MRALASTLLATALLVLLPGVLRAEDELLKPTKAQTALRDALKKVPYDEREAEAKRRSLEYLERWKASGRTATSADRYALAQFHQSAEQYLEAWQGFASVAKDTEAKEKTRDYASSAEAGLLVMPALRRQLGQDQIDEAVKRLTAYADAMEGDARLKGRSTLRILLARAHAMAARPQLAQDLRLKVLAEDPKQLASLVRPLAQGLVAQAGPISGHDALRAEAARVFKVLRDMQQQTVDAAKAKLDGMLRLLRESSPDSLDGEGHLKKTDPKEMEAGERAVYSAERSYDGATALMARITGYEKPFALLGKPAADWTLVKAFGDVKGLADLKGKVVVVDFFTTWMDQCSFPVLRDLHRAFAERGLAIVGATVTAQVVYEQRYDIDDDLRHKASGGRVYAARRASAEVPADEGKAILEEAVYLEREQQAIEAFARNHDLPWPIVMVDKDEVGPKYALEGWPHLLVLDKQGRVRRFATGALERGETEEVEALRSLIQALLAE